VPDPGTLCLQAHYARDGAGATTHRVAERADAGHAGGVVGEEDPPAGPEDIRTWTVEEANAALGWVAEVVARAQEGWDVYRAHATRRARLVRQNGHGLVPADPTPIQGCIDELAAEGIVLRDVARGLIDFPARAPSGRIYWLCWLAGEDAVEWWHWPEDGFAGRTPLTDPPS
jgi:hypothetical protein